MIKAVFTIAAENDPIARFAEQVEDVASLGNAMKALGFKCVDEESSDLNDKKPKVRTVTFVKEYR